MRPVGNLFLLVLSCSNIKRTSSLWRRSVSRSWMFGGFLVVACRAAHCQSINNQPADTRRSSPHHSQQCCRLVLLPAQTITYAKQSGEIVWWSEVAENHLWSALISNYHTPRRKICVPLSHSRADAIIPPQSTIIFLHDAIVRQPDLTLRWRKFLKKRKSCRFMCHGKFSKRAVQTDNLRAPSRPPLNRLCIFQPSEWVRWEWSGAI